jgi:hypothetical protein
MRADRGRRAMPCQFIPRGIVPGASVISSRQFCAIFVGRAREPIEAAGVSYSGTVTVDKMRFTPIRYFRNTRFEISAVYRPGMKAGHRPAIRRPT